MRFLTSIGAVVVNNFDIAVYRPKSTIFAANFQAMAHKAGFVNIIGNPNVGKSTLMNAFVGERLSIITNKAQTTRHRIMGIVNGDDFQMVYSDTPGILKPHYKLQEAMLKFVDTALVDADIIVYVTDMVETFDKNGEYLEKVRKKNIPIILHPVSALHKFNTAEVFEKIKELLPENPPYFDKDELTDRTQRFFVQEIIREKIFLNYKKEIPYSCEVLVDEFKEGQELTRIRAIIYVSREQHKGIIIGHQGAALKKVGTEARKDIEQFVGTKVFLELLVKVQKDWRDKDQNLRFFGYEQD